MSHQRIGRAVEPSPEPVRTEHWLSRLTVEERLVWNTIKSCLATRKAGERLERKLLGIAHNLCQVGQFRQVRGLAEAEPLTGGGE